MTYADIKIRKEYADMLKMLAMKLRIKVADVMMVWPKCPKCMSPLAQYEEGEAICPNCRRKYFIVERP
jgi:uncharacterized Zn finger protein (UPF0148 family)